MTRQEFEARYQLLRPLDGEAHRTHLARSRSGAIVMVHFLDGRPSEWADGRLARLETIEPSRREKIIDLVDDDHSGAVVTRFLMDFHSFANWMEVSGPSAAGTPTDGSVSRVDSEASGPGSDPTRGTPASESGSLPSAGLPDLPPTLGAFPAFGAVSGAPDSPAPGPGEFTQAFLASVGGAPSEPVLERSEARPPPPDDPGAHPSDPPPAPEPTGPNPEAEKEMGEFTRAFRARVPSDEDTRDPDAQSLATDLPLAEAARVEETPSPGSIASETQPEVAPEMGEFTRAFRASALTGSTGDLATDKSASARLDDGQEDEAPPAGEGIPSAGRTPTDAPTPPTLDKGDREPMGAADSELEPHGEFTGMFRAQRLPAADARQQPEIPSQASRATLGESEPASPAGGGEFTRAFRGLSPAEVEGPAAPTSPPPAEDRPTPPSTGQPGEFTQMFRAHTDKTGDVGAQSRPEVPQAPAVPPAPPPPPPPPKSGEGEFTKMFRAPSAPSAPSAPEGPRGTPPPRPSAPYVPEPPPAPSNQPGEFTRAMRSLGDPAEPAPLARPPMAPPQPAPPAQPPPPQPSTAKGEFTTMFEKLAGAPPPPPPTPPAHPAYGSGPATGPMWPSSDPGLGDDRYRDRLFNAPVGPTHVPPPPPAAPRQGGVVPVDPELPPLPAQMAPPPPPPTQVGGEYTRMISSFAPPPAPPPGPSHVAAPGSPPPGGALAKKAGALATAEVNSRLPRTGLLLWFAAIGFSALVLILYLVMKSVMMPATTETEAATDSAAAAAPAEASPPP